MEPENNAPLTSVTDETSTSRQVKTPSKYLAITLCIVTLLMGGLIGYRYAPSNTAPAQSESVPVQIESEKTQVQSLEQLQEIFSAQISPDYVIERLYTSVDNIQYFKVSTPYLSACCTVYKFLPETNIFLNTGLSFNEIIGEKISPTGRYLVNIEHQSTQDVLKVYDLETEDIEKEILEYDTLTPHTCGVVEEKYDLRWLDQYTLQYGVFYTIGEEDNCTNRALIEYKTLTIEPKFHGNGFIDVAFPLALFPNSQDWSKKRFDNEVDVSTDDLYAGLHNDDCFESWGTNGKCLDISLVGSEYSFVEDRNLTTLTEAEVMRPYEFQKFYYWFDNGSLQGYLGDLGFQWLGGSDGLPTRDYQVFRKVIGDTAQTVIVRYYYEYSGDEAISIFDDMPSAAHYKIFISDPYRLSKVQEVLSESDNFKIEFLNPKRDGAHMVYDVKDGVVTGEWGASYGPSSYAGNWFEFIPDVASEPINEFGFWLVTEDNLVRESFNELFNYNLAELENSLSSSMQACHLKGGRATIKISRYGELVADKSVRDYAVLEDVIEFSPAKEIDCF